MLEWSEDRSNRLSRYILKPIAQFLSRNPSREYYSILAGRTVGFKGISLERQKLSLSLRSGLHPFEVHSWIPDPESLEVQHGGSLDSFCPKGPSCVQRECSDSPQCPRVGSSFRKQGSLRQVRRDRLQVAVVRLSSHYSQREQDDSHCGGRPSPGRNEAGLRKTHRKGRTGP